ncbi:MAG: hypothetical protein ILP16_10685 [Spirochaetales bacterium]|nr:hypothetical protein [Spirochaetales bacterium]
MFLELVPSDIQHAYDNHLHAKIPGNIDLSEADFENIPKYFDQYDDLLYAKTYPNGNRTICVSKQISNGRVLIIEVVSNGKNAVQFKNAIGVSEEQYVNKVLPENKKSLANSRGSESSNEPRPDAQAQFAETTKVVSDLEAIASTENIPQSSQESNSIPPNPVMKRSQTESHTLQQVAEEAGGQQEKLYYPSVTEKQTLAAAQARVKQDFMGEMNALTEKSSWTAEDVDTAFTIQGILQADGVRTRDFSAAQAWAKVVQDRITRSAQSLQAVSKWSRTGQAIVQDAMVDLSESNISAEEQSQIINDMQALADRLDATEDGDLESIRQLILDLNSKRNTGTFFKSRFSKYLDTITDFDWLKEFATRQLMSVPTDYTETASLGQKLKTWQTLAQLLRLPTFNRNIGGNVTFSGMDALVQDSFGIAIDSLVSKLTGVREVGFNKWWFSSKARQAAGDAYTKSILEVAADIDMTGEGNKYTPGGGRSFKMTGNAAERFMSRLEQLLSYSLTTSDRVSRGQIETANVEGLENANSRMTNAKADMITSDKSLSQTFTDITGVELNGTKADNRTAIKEQAADVVEFLVNEAENGTINPAQQALLDVIQRGKMTEERASAIAEQAADYDLFQNESTATRVSKGAHDALNTMGIGGTVDKTGRHGGFGVGDMLNPYPGVPANLGAKPIEFSPAGIAKGTYDLVKLLSDAKNGKTVDAGAQHKAVMEISRGMAGTPIIVALAALFRSGAIKNADDEDDLDAAAQAAAEGRSGVQWNLSATMRLLRGESGEWQDGDDLMSISWLEPLNAFMAIASLVANDTEEDATLGSILKSTGKNYLQGSIQSILDMPVMSSISNVIDTFKYSNADTIGGKVGEAALQLAGDSISGMMPAALFSQLAKATDDTMRSTKGDTPLETVVNGILNNIPGLRQTLDPKYDAFGEEKKYTGTDLQRWLNTYLLPGAINKFSQSETGALVESLYQETGSPDVYPDRKAPKYFNVGKEKINLTADQQTEYQSVYGQTAAGFINDFVNGAGYEDLAPEQKVEILKDLYGFAKNEAENAILEGMGMEPKEKDGYESAKKLMDEAGLSWAEYYDIKKGRDVNGDGSNSQNETVSYLLGSGFDDEKMESIYNALYPDSGNFSEVRDKVQGIEDAGFESLDEYNAANKAVSEARKNVTDEHDSSGNVAAANAVRDAKLTDEQKDVLISSVSTDFKGFYDVAREAGRSADDTIDLLLAVDATPATKSDTPGNGSISQGELKAYYLAHPEEEVIIALLWDSKAYKNGTDAGKWENNRPR